MTLRFDDDIWPDVSTDPWKFRRRTAQPTLVELHATRSGIPGRTAAEEYASTKAWFVSPNNIVREPGANWGSMASYIVGGGKLCCVLPEDRYPHYSLGHADHLAFSIEIAQATNDTPFLDEDLEIAAELCADLSTRHNIPVRVLPYLSGDNREAPGYVRHDRSANGTKYGKSDPGTLFDDAAFIERVKRHMGMTDAERARLAEAETDIVNLQKIVYAQAVKTHNLGLIALDQAKKLREHGH